MLDNGVIFDARIAEKYSVEEAIVINKLFGWLKYNAVNGKNFKEGRYWTFNSLSAFKKYFPFWNESKIKRILIDLAGCTEKSDSKPKHESVIIKGNFNKSSFDRTIWYSFTDDFFAYLVKLGYDLNADIPQAENGYSADGQMDVPPADDQYQLNKPKDKQKKENLIKESEIVDFWNENTEDYPKVKKVSDKVKKAIKARLNEGYSVEEIKCAILLMNTLGDFYKGKGDSHWKADFLWLMQNTKGNFEKILAGGLHVTAVQKHQYEIVMASQGKVDDDEYHPIYDDKSEIQFDKKANHYRLIGKDPRFSRVYDGYNDDTRPDGAILLTQYGKMKWSSESKEWDEIR